MVEFQDLWRGFRSDNDIINSVRDLGVGEKSLYKWVKKICCK